MNLSTVKSVAIPEGNATSFSIGGVKVWSDNSGGGGEPAELLSWEGVAYHINKGTYKDVYAIGDMVPLDLGSEGLINMQIAAFDTDILADGSGTAAITWVAKELLKTTHRMNPAQAGSSGAYTEGTGGIGGWEKCEMRAYLQDTIKPLIPANVSGMIRIVTKTQDAYDTAGAMFTQTTTDDVWIPTKDEVYGLGCAYGTLFTSDSIRKKYKVGSTSVTNWWLRQAYSSSTKFWRIGNTGTPAGITSSSAYGVCLGFCTGKTKTY